jgi:anti-sigma-K factor RskA
MTRRTFDGDPLDALRRVDPLDHLDAPRDTTGTHARALFQEVIEMDTMERPAPQENKQPMWRRWALAASAVAVTAAAVASS